MTKYLKLFRVNHYLKNFLIFFPIFFSTGLFNASMLLKVFFGFIIFCLLSSTIYIFNDIVDVENDKLHPKKKNRPIASGQISIPKAKFIIIALLFIIIIINLSLFFYHIYSISEFIFSSLVLAIYLFLNILYSKGLKNVPIIDILILSSGFLLRVIYGGSIISVEVSSWLYLTVLSISLYMSLGKRKGELNKNGSKSRKVLSYYTKDFLDKFMYVFLTSSIIFYSLWCIQGFQDPNRVLLLMYSVIFVIFIVMKYSLDLENDSLGDPIDVIYSDKILLIVTTLYIVYMGGIIYV